MKKILFCVLMMLGAFAHSQKLDCSKFKNGKFGAPAFPDEYLIRKDSIQESYMNGKLETVWSIKWLSDCKFEAICLQNFGSQYSKVGDKLVSEIKIIEDDCISLSMLYFNEAYPNGDVFERGLCLQKE